MVVWNTGTAAERARHNLKLKKKKNKKPQAASAKPQASSSKLQKLDPTIDWNKFLKELTK